MKKLTEKVWEMGTEEIDTEEMQIGDRVKDSAYGIGVIYSTKYLIKIAFSDSPDTMLDIWFTHGIKQLRKSNMAPGYLTKRKGDYNLAKNLLEQIK